MKSPLAKLTMPDGTERFIVGSLGKECRLHDRAFQVAFAALKKERLRRKRLDVELEWLLQCVSVDEADSKSSFRDTKRLVTTVHKLKTHFEDGTLKRGSELTQ